MRSNTTNSTSHWPTPKEPPFWHTARGHICCAWLYTWSSSQSTAWNLERKRKKFWPNWMGNSWPWRNILARNLKLQIFEKNNSQAHSLRFWVNNKHVKNWRKWRKLKEIFVEDFHVMIFFIFCKFPRSSQNIHKILHIYWFSYIPNNSV